MAFNVGDTAGDYQILSVLGAGGMGKVYKARNVITDRVEALKVLLPDLSNDAELADRFMREIKVLASLGHPNIAALHTALRIDNQLLMVMEFVEGRTIEDRLKDGPIPPGEAVAYACQALSALAFAHERGVVHRDIKPANMMVTPDGQLKLMDFGIAKAVGNRGLTMAGTTLGSLFYMSPEQVKGSGDLDGRSDLYSVGVSLYEMVTGKRPFQGGSDYSIMVAHLEQMPVPPIQIDPTLLPALNEIILTAIQKDRENRFQSAQAFRGALESVAPSLGQPARPPMPVAAPQPTAAPQAPPPLPFPSPSVTVTQPVPVVQPQQPPTMPQAAPLLPPLPTMPQATPPPPLPQQQPVAWAEPPVAAAAQAQRSGHRGLWMALGGLIVLVLLAGAAIQGPRWYRTWAAGRGQSAVPAVTPEPAHAPPDTPPAESATPAVPVPPAAVPPPAVPAATAPPAALSHASHPSSGRPARAESGQAPAEPPQPVAPPQPPAPPAVDTGRLEELRDRLGSLAPRANAIRSSLNNLERQQRAAGYGLRGDISASRQRMEYLLDEAQAALNAGNPDRAQKNLDLAEQEADKLDKFLGR